MTKGDIQTVKGAVEEILSRSVRARSDDTFLMLRVLDELDLAEIDLQNMEVKIDISEENMKKMPNLASIKRVRAKLQNDQGKFLPPKNVRENRSEAEKDMNNINQWFDRRDQ